MRFYRTILRSFLFAVLIPSLAWAENFPTDVEEAASTMAATCSLSTQDTIRALVTPVALENGDIVYVLDGSQTPCGDSGTSLCGTGGCLLELFRGHGDTIKVLYDEQVWSWEISSNGTQLITKVHPSYCGGQNFAESCEVIVDTMSGKKRAKARQ